MTGTEQFDVGMCGLIEKPNRFGIATGSALLTPDSDDEHAIGIVGPWSDYPAGFTPNTAWCSAGDDLDDDEAYFLEDEDDDDPDDDDLEDEFDDDDFDDEEIEADSDLDSDDEDL